MTSRNCARFLLATLVVSMTSQANARQKQEEVVHERGPDAGEVATTPLRDLNLMRDDLPEVLAEAVMATYASERLVECADIEREIARLDAVLGNDLDQEQDEQGRISVGRLAEQAVGSFIPFRSIIREISGAADTQRDLREAIVAGFTRRGFLKGLGEARDCPFPARPMSVRVTVDGAHIYEMGTGQLAVGRAQTMQTAPTGSTRSDSSKEN